MLHQTLTNTAHSTNGILKRFISARWDPSFVLQGSRFAERKFSHVIASACLSGMKDNLTHAYKGIKRKCKQIHSNTRGGWGLSLFAGMKFDFPM